MRLHTSPEDALYAAEGERKHIAKFCPFHIRMSTKTLCGSWCPHFFYDEKEIYITCSGKEVCVGVKE